MEYKLRYYQQEGVDKAVENLELREDKYGWAVWDSLHNRQLTNVDL